MQEVYKGAKGVCQFLDSHTNDLCDSHVRLP